MAAAATVLTLAPTGIARATAAGRSAVEPTILESTLADVDVDALVLVDRYAVQPRTVMIEPGGSVTFRASRGVDHLLGPMAAVIVLSKAAPARGFESPPLRPGKSWTHVFTKPGIYHYALEDHESVQGVIVVE